MKPQDALFHQLTYPLCMFPPSLSSDPGPQITTELDKAIAKILPQIRPRTSGLISIELKRITDRKLIPSFFKQSDKDLLDGWMIPFRIVEAAPTVSAERQVRTCCKVILQVCDSDIYMAEEYAGGAGLTVQATLYDKQMGIFGGVSDKAATLLSLRLRDA